MNSNMDCTQANLIQTSFWGTARGASVEVLIYPLEVIKIRQQCSQNAETSIQIARRVFQKEGARAFYKGLSPQLVKTCLKQIWCWPMITGIPSYLQSYGIEGTHQQILTGLSIATVDATITIPLERAKILSALTKKRAFSLASVYKDGWQGFAAYWAKRSINMITFLTVQKHLRDQARTQPEQVLSSFQLAKIGTQVAVIVSLVSAPFDVTNTLKQAQKLSPSQFWSRHGILKSYRGWPLNALSLIIHNIASVIVLEKVSK